MSIVQVDPSILLQVIVLKVNNAKTYEVFNLEEPERKGLHAVLGRELEASVPRVIHVDRTDSR